LAEDLKIRDILRKETAQAGVSNIEIGRFPQQISINIHTAKPGIIIGRKGASINAMRERLEKMTGKKVHIDVLEVEQPELEASLVAESIARQITQRISHKRAMKQAVQRAMRIGAKGMKVVCSGRLAGAEMARREWVREGRVPLHTLRADIDFARAEALTTYGRVGVKVWIYKGDVMPAPAG
jgi:small subunit ribosomal protein S3